MALDLAGVTGRMSGRLIVCPTPIGNLEDVTLRVLSALRDADVDRLRGHAHDEGAARPLRGVGRARALRRARRAARGAASWSSGCASGAVVALVSDAGMPLVSDPGLVLVQACMAAGLEVEVLPGPERGAGGAGGVGHGGRDVALRRLPAAQEGRAGGGLRVARGRGGLRVAAAGGGVAGGAGGASIPIAPVAVCRELTKVYEEVVRGSASELAARYARGGAAGRGGARDRRRAGRRGRRSARRWPRCGGWSTRAERGRARRRPWWPSSPGRARMRCIAR